MELKEVIMKRFLRKLLNLNFNIKISTGEKHVSLNSHKQKEIYEFLKEDYPQN